MKKLPHPSIKYLFLIFGIVLLVYTPIGFLTYLFFQSQNNIDTLQMSYSEVKKAQDNFELNLSEELFNEHLSLIEKQNIQDQLNTLEEEFSLLKDSPEGSVNYSVSEIYDLYGDFEAKVSRNDKAALSTDEALEKIEKWGTLLIEQDFETLEAEITELTTKIDEEYKEYLSTLPPPAPAASTGYSYVTINTEKGSSHGVNLIKVSKSSVRVVTASASGSDCKDNCPTKSLQQFVQDNGGFAGINGSYFCPPDYASCNGKVNSFDYAFYHSANGKWINKDARSWSKTGLLTFNGGSPSFYKKSSDFSGGSVTAAISNYPSLLKNGEVVVKDSDLTSYQKIKGTRGAVGSGDENLYFAIIYNATVEEAAYAMKALGAKDALNLDGGGSSAMYIDGRYVVGPGRSLPNAIVLVR